MADFLLELRCEEIPARMQAGARADLEKLFRAQMAEAGVETGAITVWSTPRRLALIARDLPAETQAVSEETKGPPLGAPDQALEGFLRKVGLTKDQLEVRDLKGKDTYFAVIEKPGRAVSQVLAEAIPAIIRAFPWPKSMRWGAASISTESLRWVRPLSGIVAILGEDLVEFEIGGVTSGYATKGHRFHAPGEITIGGAHDYADKLRACHVLVDHEERQDIVRSKAREAASAAGLTLVEDEGLVIENAGLTEWPVPLLGRFDEAFLDVPPEVIQLTARVNQKYFVCEDSAGKLANAFVCTANIEASDGGEAIVAGNRKVLAARLSDARFFWEQDLKTPLAQQAEKLSRITFHEKLGTVADKVERVAKLAEWLASEGIVPDCDPAQARQAAELCKADLVTEMVGEFPELQGLMGGYYARAEGLPDAVADAIRDHYKPVGQGDEVPVAPVTVAVSLADKLDTLFGFFSIEQLPTGSKDPFALRRQTIAGTSLSLVNDLRYSIEHLIEVLGVIFHEQFVAAMAWDIPGLQERLSEYLTSNPKRDKHAYEHLDMLYETSKERYLESLPEGVAVTENPELADPETRFNQERRLGAMFRAYAGWHKWFSEWSEIEAVKRPLLDFFADRLKVQQREAGVRHDLIDAVFALGGEDDLVRLLARVHALQAFIGTEDGTNLLAGYKRAANILKKEDYKSPLPPAGGAGGGSSRAGDLPTPNPSRAREGNDISLSYTPEPAEKALIDSLAEAGPKAEAAVAAEDFAGAMAALATLRGPIDAFFDSVTVNDLDADKRAARLGLLDAFRAAVHNVADFSRIEG
ncbi:MAG: glycine--tRNA ligase subunit beta [Novosphingobium sp.]|nr:glycine--tRNA ligase subunit beta [Novosphingobium sp.]